MRRIKKWRWLIAVISAAAIICVIGWKEKRCQSQAYQCRASYAAQVQSEQRTRRLSVYEQATEQQAIETACEPNGYFCRLFSAANIPTVLLVLIGIGAIWAAIKTLKAIRRQAAIMLRQTKATEASVKALIDSERPWLLIPIENKIYDIQPPVIVERLAGTPSVVSSGCAFGVKNYGRSPARVIERRLWMIRIKDASFPHLSAYAREGSLPMDYVVAPGTTIPVSVRLEGGDGKLTPQEWEAIETEKNFLWLAGYLKYTDTFDRQGSPIYETRICYRWIPRSYLIPVPFWWREGPSEYNGTT